MGFFITVSNKRQNGWTDQAQILCLTSHDPSQGSFMNDQNFKNLPPKSLIFIKFENPRIVF